jgi:aryl-alcohol dehydrogenase-like predicted oxidoreductase
MSTHATAEGTRRYVARFAAAAAAGHFREPVGCGTPAEGAPLLSSLGIGTYLGEADAATDKAYTAAVIAAVEGGMNVIDTAINYRYQRSERAIGAALRELAARGFERDEIVLCTKGGFLTTDGSMPADAHDYLEREYVASGILEATDVAAGCHAISPAFLADQLDRSRKNLGVDCVDIYYLHNPETQLDEVPREEFALRLRAAFEFLESACAAGKIRFYGAATWNGFRQPPGAKDLLSLAAMEAIAREVAGSAHHFRFVQLPFNLAMTEALTRANQEIHGPPVMMIEAAEALGISLVASASLLQGKMAKGLPKFIADSLGLRTDAERALQFVRSSPGIKTALIGMSKVEHVRANLSLVSEPLADADQFSRLFDRGEKK